MEPKLDTPIIIWEYDYIPRELLSMIPNFSECFFDLQRRPEQTPTEKILTGTKSSDS